jgi:hypothetical protein
MVNRDDLIAYLLHRMPEDERAALGERWMTDPDLYAQLCAAEADLLDAYVRNEVSPGDRALIEQHLLGSENQRRKLAFARALHTALPAKRRWPVWILPAAAAAMIALIAAMGWFAQQNQRLRHEMAALRAQPPPPPAGNLYATLLPLTSVRGAAGERRVIIPAGAEVVRLDLELEPGDENANYSATISMMSTGAEVVWREEPVRALRRGAAFVAPVWIPATVLVPGRYEVALTAGGKAIAYYHVTIADSPLPPAR